jgi:hypothetical protein
MTQKHLFEIRYRFTWNGVPIIVPVTAVAYPRFCHYIVTGVSPFSICPSSYIDVMRNNSIADKYAREGADKETGIFEYTPYI